MKRNRFIALVVVIALAALLAVPIAGCQRKVEVKTGLRVLCTYGHQVSSSVRTIEVPVDKASQYAVKTKTITCPDHLQAEKAYQEAQDDIGKADIKGAAEKLAQVVAIDSSFKRAQAQLSDIKAGKIPTADPGSGSASTPPSSSGPGSNTGTKPTNPGDKGPASGPIASLAGWTPDTISGFTAEKAIADVFVISREYVPESGGKGVLVIAAEQFVSSKSAADALKANVKVPYASDGKAVKVNGKTGYIGTNNRDTTVLGVLNGPVLVIFQMRTDGGKPSALFNDVLGIAETLPR